MDNNNEASYTNSNKNNVGAVTVATSALMVSIFFVFSHSRLSEEKEVCTTDYYEGEHSDTVNHDETSRNPSQQTNRYIRD